MSDYCDRCGKELDEAEYIENSNTWRCKCGELNKNYRGDV